MRALCQVRKENFAGKCHTEDFMEQDKCLGIEVQGVTDHAFDLEGKMAKERTTAAKLDRNGKGPQRLGG